MCKMIITSFRYRKVNIQNQSSTYFKSHIETKMSSGETKQPSSGGDRQQKYEEQHGLAVHLNQLLNF